jgi:hypothetical protein
MSSGDAQFSSAPSRTDEAETGSLGNLRAGLPEIGIHSFKDWDIIIIPKLEDKVRDGTQDVKSICKDPLKIEKVAAYIIYERPRASTEDLPRASNQNKTTWNWGFRVA